MKCISQSRFPIIVYKYVMDIESNLQTHSGLIATKDSVNVSTNMHTTSGYLPTPLSFLSGYVSCS